MYAFVIRWKLKMLDDIISYITPADWLNPKSYIGTSACYM